MTTGLSIAEWFKRPMVKKLPEARFLAIRLLPEKPCSTAAAICVLTL